MIYKTITIPPKGRNKYGNYTSTGNITKQIVSYNNGGNSTSTRNNNSGNDGTTTTTQPNKNYSLILSKNTGNFEWDDIVAMNGQVDSISVLGYGSLENVPTFVGDISLTPSPDLQTTDQRNYDILNIPKGMSIAVVDNGTTGTTIDITITDEIEEKHGSILIPCSVYVGDENNAPYAPSINPETGEEINNAGAPEDYYDWVGVQSDCRTLWLEYSYSVLYNAVNNYSLELSNEIAGINVDINGNIVGDINALSCEAYLYLGQTKIETAQFNLSYSDWQNVVGVSMDGNRVKFEDNFDFDGTNLELRISATYDNYSSTKIMNINKIYPGKDGTPAINRWIVANPNIIKYDPNTNQLSHDFIDVYIMKQEGTSTPVLEKTSVLKYGYDTDTPATNSIANNLGHHMIEVRAGANYISLGIPNNASSNGYMDIETIPIISEGVNGGKGDSSYSFVLTNSNMTINCNSDGQFITAPDETLSTYAHLYYGTEEITNIVLSSATESTYAGTFGFSDTSEGWKFEVSSDFFFPSDSIIINVSVYRDNILIATSIININKVKQGADGADAVRYYLSFSNSMFREDKSGVYSPTGITCTAYRQVGAKAPQVLSLTQCTIAYTFSAYPVKQQYTGVALQPDKLNTIWRVSSYITWDLIVGGIIVDTQTMPILRDGANGSDGERGLTGPTLRGPVDYNKINSPRRFCNGVLTDSNYPDDAKFIDIVSILIPGENERTYWKCIKSYNWNEQDIDWWDTTGFNQCWEKADQFNFVATDVLLADQAKIANFIFSGDKLVSEAVDTNLNPMVELDGKNGIIRAKKGIWEAAVWQPFKSPNYQTGLNPSDSNIIMHQTTSLNSYALLPQITPSIDGAKFCVFWDGEGSRVAMDVERLRTSSTDAIIHLECFNKNMYGTPTQIRSIWCDYFTYGYIELVANYKSNRGDWIITNITGSHWMVELMSGQEVALSTLIEMNNSNN